MIVPIFSGTLGGGVKRDRFFAGATSVADQVERFDQLVAFERVLAAEAIGIRPLLNFAARKTGGDDSGARLHFDLVNHGADGRDEELIDFAKRHRAFGERDAFRAPHLLVGSEKHLDLALDGNAERVFHKRILPGVDVGVFWSERNVRMLRERGGFGDGDCCCGAGVNAFMGEAVGGREPPCARRDYANADAERFRFDEGADFAVFRRNVALADVHHARVGVGGATALGGIDGAGCPVLHYE